MIAVFMIIVATATFLIWFLNVFKEMSILLYRNILPGDLADNRRVSAG